MPPTQAVRRCDNDDDIIRVIESEYAELPGLALTKPQARRLFGLEPARCDEVLEKMVASKRLRRTAGEMYVLDRETC